MITEAATSTIDTPNGPFTAIVTTDEVVLASGWTAAPDDLLPQVAPSARPERLRHREELGPVTAAVRAYHDGDLAAIDDIAVHQVSGPFLRRAWQVLRTIPAGQTATYTEFAALAGNQKATRAAANACARNAAALFVPCHRVLRSGNGPLSARLGGFRWGTDVKLRLLDHEHALPG